jgi:HAD superfamily hydrolase (TIGR01509 family)
MPKLPDFDAVIFDMDGLVLDTESTYRLAWQQAAAAMGYDLSEPFCLSLSGLQYRAVEQKLLALCGADFNLNEFNQLSAGYWHQHVNANGIKVKKGFGSLLEHLIKEKIPYCLTTNSRALNAHECLELAGLKNVFTTVVTRDHVLQGKPEPDIFIKAAELLSVNISRCLVLEDSHAGIVGATRAGAFSVFIPSLWPVEQRTADLCDVMMHDLTQLAETLAA